MKAIILSAGQGRRLLPLTADTPKCAVRIHGKSMVEWQIDELIKAGINEILVVLGFRADRVEELLADRYGFGSVRTLYNPFFSLADNLGTCWVARAEMNEDFLLLNGDTLFDSEVLRRLVKSPVQPVTVTIDRKLAYDADDMKVQLDGDRLVRIGKNLPLDQVDAESIGMLLFRKNGPLLFRDNIEKVLRTPEGTKRWYLSVIDEMAQSMTVGTCCIEGLPWAEVDFPDDLERAEKVVKGIAENCSKMKEKILL